MTARLLYITHCFPPYAFPESFLAAKRMGNIPDVLVDVFTTHAFLPWVRYDDSLDEYVKSKFRKITRIRPSTWYSKLPFHRLQSFFSLPDSYRWLQSLYLKKIGSLPMYEYDLLNTSSTFHSAHLIGASLKKRYPNLPWIAHFSDPWTKNPYSQQNKIVYGINKYLELKVLKNADTIVFTSQETANLTLSNYPEFERKAVVISHCFDESLYESKNGNSFQVNSPFLIRYVGNFYGVRQPTSFLKALGWIAEREPGLASQFCIEFIGSFDKEILKIEPNLSQMVKIRSSVNYKDSLSLMKEADLLLVIDAPFEMNVFLPSKLIDYIGAGRPIFGITPPGTTRAIIEKLEGICIAPDRSPEEIALALIKVIEHYKKCPYEINNNIREQYTAQAIGTKIKAIIDQALLKRT